MSVGSGITPGGSDGYVRRIHEAELLDHIGIDPSGVGQILDSLAEAGIPDESVVGISQGWKLGGAIKTTERNWLREYWCMVASP